MTYSLIVSGKVIPDCTCSLKRFHLRVFISYTLKATFEYHSIAAFSFYIACVYNHNILKRTK